FLAAFPGWVHLGLLGYRLLFLLPVCASLFNLSLLACMKESRVIPARPAPTGRSRVRRRSENRSLRKLVVLNSVNGFAVGLIGPLMSYWFSVRFGIGPASIAPVMALAFAVTGVASLLTGRLTERIGLVKSVVGMRSVGLLLLVALPLMPTYTLAALVYFL
ncbi:major facilitator superfamily transporter, partial [mine drainage metagenome]